MSPEILEIEHEKIWLFLRKNVDFQELYLMQLGSEPTKDVGQILLKNRGFVIVDSVLRIENIGRAAEI